jgi:hypothetical protein
MICADKRITERGFKSLVQAALVAMAAFSTVVYADPAVGTCPAFGDISFSVEDGGRYVTNDGVWRSIDSYPQYDAGNAPKPEYLFWVPFWIRTPQGAPEYKEITCEYETSESGIMPIMQPSASFNENLGEPVSDNWSLSQTGPNGTLWSCPNQNTKRNPEDCPFTINSGAVLPSFSTNSPFGTEKSKR